MNKPLPFVGVDILVYDAMLLSEEECEDIIRRAAELRVPVFFWNFAAHFGR